MEIFLGICVLLPRKRPKDVHCAVQSGTNTTNDLESFRRITRGRRGGHGGESAYLALVARGGGGQSRDPHARGPVAPKQPARPELDAPARRGGGTPGGRHLHR